MFSLIKDENIILAKRRHYIIFILQSAPIVFILVLLLFFTFFNFFIDLTFLQYGIYTIFGLNVEEIKLHFLTSFLSASMAAFLWFIVLFNFIFFYFDVWFLTNKRIVKTNIVNIFYKKTSTVSLKNIENIRASRKGLLAIIYKFGDIEIETAGNYENFKLVSISYHEKFKNAIFRAMEENEEQKYYRKEQAQNTTNSAKNDNKV